MNLKKYLSLTRAGILESLQFRLSTVIIFVGNLLYLIVVYFLWKAIYASSGQEVVNGMTFSDTLIYLVLATALFNFMEMYIVWEIGRSIQSGSIVLYLIKPMECRKYLFWSYSGTFVVNFFATLLPTFVVVCFVTHGAIPLGINLLYFVIAVVLAVVINYNIDLFVGTICMYTESIWGINIMKQVIVSLLSGATIPIAFFPEAIRRIVYYLPFQSIYNAPLTLLLNDSPDISEAASVIGVQLLWVVVTGIISRVFWKISLPQITVNGG